MYLDPFFNSSFFVCLFVFFALWSEVLRKEKPELNVLKIASVELFSFNCVFFLL